MPPRLVLLVTHPMTARYLLRGQPRDLVRRGFEVILVTSPGPDLEAVETREGIEVHTVPMVREIAPLRDLRALLRLTRLLRRLAPDVVNAGTPKAGFLGMLAARRAGVPIRVYTLRGLRLETARGLRRRLLTHAEKSAARAAHRVVAVSPSLRRRSVELGLAPEEKIEVLGPGTSNGVDPERFAATPERRRAAETMRRELGLPAGAPVIGFVGRLTRDKGIRELLDAFERIRSRRPDARLLLVGDFEPGDPVSERVRERVREHPSIHFAGFTPDPAPCYLLMDVLAFPSHREGFPNAPLEAAAAGVPTVGFAATGTVDAVVDGETGRLVSVGDVEALARGLEAYLEDAELRRAHGEAARERVLAELSDRRVWERWSDLYRRLLADRPTLTRPFYPPALVRALDLLVALPLLALTLPVTALAALAIRLSTGPPVLFRQERPGWRGRPFTLLKLRTMREARDEEGRPLPDAERLTGLGKALRATSLDELPTLWNVVRGDMRLVGPRPLLTEYLDRYSPRQARRHEVRPGITGWAQIHGRNALSWEEKLRLDVWYVEHRSLGLDLRILAATLLEVLTRRGIHAEGHATMPEFRPRREGEAE
jgi:lipopolysaccharide/colanic/teichoic acid biosynthesis glycosyltransferase/glycosyltransferase involved in cell wall biosynthesis